MLHDQFANQIESSRFSETGRFPLQFSPNESCCRVQSFQEERLASLVNLSRGLSNGHRFIIKIRSRIGKVVITYVSVKSA